MESSFLFRCRKLSVVVPEPPAPLKFRPTPWRLRRFGCAAIFKEVKKQIVRTRYVNFFARVTKI
jgi:hypothetical protein